MLLMLLMTTTMTLTVRRSLRRQRAIMTRASWAECDRPRATTMIRVQPWEEFQSVPATGDRTRRDSFTRSTELARAAFTVDQSALWTAFRLMQRLNHASHQHKCCCCCCCCLTVHVHHLPTPAQQRTCNRLLPRMTMDPLFEIRPYPNRSMSLLVT